MSRTLSLAALSTLLLATAVDAYSGAAPAKDGYWRAVNQSPSAASRTLTSIAASDVPVMQGDNCGVDGYPWLTSDGQPMEG